MHINYDSVCAVSLKCTPCVMYLSFSSIRGVLHYTGDIMKIISASVQPEITKFTSLFFNTLAGGFTLLLHFCIAHKSKTVVE